MKKENCEGNLCVRHVSHRIWFNESSRVKAAFYYSSTMYRSILLHVAVQFRTIMHLQRLPGTARVLVTKPLMDISPRKVPFSFQLDKKAIFFGCEPATFARGPLNSACHACCRTKPTVGSMMYLEKRMEDPRA